MRVWSHSRFTFPLPDGHRYPLGKYERLSALLAAEDFDVAEPAPAGREALERVHDPDFVRRVLAGELDRREQRVLGLPWSAALVVRSLRGVQGTYEATRDALAHGAGVMLGGGTHHAGRASARGYCLFNDLAVVTALLRDDGLAWRVLVVDCDVHQGDGTAELLGPDRDAFTVSLQCERNYPFTRIPSDLDVELAAGTGDDDYLAALDAALAGAARRFGVPDVVLYVAGADPWEGDALGRLALTKDGLAARDALVLGRAGAPVVVTLAGGYADDVDELVEINAATVRAARDHASGSATTGIGVRLPHTDDESELSATALDEQKFMRTAPRGKGWSAHAE